MLQHYLTRVLIFAVVISNISFLFVVAKKGKTLCIHSKLICFFFQIEKFFSVAIDINKNKCWHILNAKIDFRTGLLNLVYLTSINT